MTEAQRPDNGLLRLFKPETIRERAADLLARAEAGELGHVSVDMAHLETAVANVLQGMKTAYPDLQIPPYGIWRALELGGVDRWDATAAARRFETAEEMLIAAADFAVLAVMMKTASPAGWLYRDAMTGVPAGGADASVLAAFGMFTAGSFSADIQDPVRVDAETLVRLDTEELASGLQWNAQGDADLVGEMQAHLKRFGEALALRPDLFGEGEVTRPGILAAQLASSGGGTVDARDMLDRILEALAPVWAGGAVAENIALGDAYRHSGLGGRDTEAIVPFHLAAQEMVYSLVEPFAWAGCKVAGLEALTAPADPSLAALFAETGVLVAKTAGEDLDPPAALDRMIEIRGVTVALVDRLAGHIRDDLDVPAEQLPLTCILEGARHRTADGSKPESSAPVTTFGKILNPGSVFWLPFGA